MDAVERVRQLIEIMAEHDLAEIEVEEPDLRIKIRKNLPIQYLPPGLNYTQLQQPPVAHPALQMPVEAERSSAALDQEEKLLEIASPMVGTFYRASSPGADSYVSIGSEVGPDTVVCIIEAMKVMNELKAGVVGTIHRVLVENGTPVEYGQPLFEVVP